MRARSMLLTGIVAAAALVLGACAEMEQLAPTLERLADAVTDEDGNLDERVTGTLGGTFGGGTEVTVRAQVDASYHVGEAELLLHGWEGTVRHDATGTFGSSGAWQLSHVDAAGTAAGYEVCYDDDGSVWQVDWESDVHWPGFEPQVELELHGDEVAVLFALDWMIGFEHPGARACAAGGPTPAGPDTTYFSMEVLDGERSPNADSSSRPGIQDGIVVLRIPADELDAGGSWSGRLATAGAEDGVSATLDVDLQVSSG
jgi:hypothetical protein